METTAKIYQASDLNQRGRAILDTARHGFARVRDKDGFSLVMLPEEKLNALITIAKGVANLSTIEHALANFTSQHPDVYEYGEWTWLRVFDEEDLREFVHEMHEAMLVASREESPGFIEETLYRWRSTARALDDTLRRSILLGAPSDDDFIEITRPE